MKRLSVGFLCAIAAVTTLACSAKDDAGSWIARAESANTQADQRLSSGDKDGARAALQRAAEAEAPKGTSLADARAVRQDLLYRLAGLELDQGDAKEAVRHATAGLDLGRSTDVFTTNLLIVRGRAFERLGDPRTASRDYHDALLVTESLLDKSLEGGAP